MTDAEFEEQKAKVSALFEKWIPALSLGCWRIAIEYEREPMAEASRAKRGGNWRTTFLCNSDWRYQDAMITAYLSVIADVVDAELEDCVVHELCHIHLNETRQGGKDWLDHEERVATTLAKAFISLSNAGESASQVMVLSIPEGAAVSLSSAIDNT